MKLTNRLRLPQPLVDAVKNDPYTRGEASISVTGLLKPPRQAALEEKHQDEIQEDASDRMWSLLGQVVHGILERANSTGIAERRLSVQVEGWTISGQMDRYEDGLLQDYKLVTAYKFKDGGVPEEYEAQLNVYAELLRQNGHPVDRLEIVGILRDWSKLEARRDPEYPQSQVVLRRVKLWEPARAEAFLRERVILHQQARIELPECSPQDRWAKPGVFALMKKGRKSAVKLYASSEEAESHASSDPVQLSVFYRPGQSVRCENYCSVSSFCSQWAGIQEELKEKADASQKESVA